MVDPLVFNVCGMMMFITIMVCARVCVYRSVYAMKIIHVSSRHVLAVARLIYCFCSILEPFFACSNLFVCVLIERHPDKWCQYKLDIAQREVILERITNVSQEINSLPICVSASDSALLRYQVCAHEHMSIHTYVMHVCVHLCARVCACVVGSVFENAYMQHEPGRRGVRGPGAMRPCFSRSRASTPAGLRASLVLVAPTSSRLLQAAWTK